MIHFREARREDVPAIVALLTDDMLGEGREGATPEIYLAAFDEVAASPSNAILVAEQDGRIVATYQLTIIPGLSLKATRRAQIESVRVASTSRGLGLGEQLMADAEARARAAGCTLLQLTTNRSRERAHRFYERLGFTPSHIGFKRVLN